MTAKSPSTAKGRAKKKSALNVPIGIAHICASFNNTIVTITDPQGRVLTKASAGSAGFNHSKKSSSFAGTSAAQQAAQSAKQIGMREVKVRVKGPGAGRESAVRGLQAAGLTVTEIRDTTPVPHNGCKPRKRRRA